MRMASPTFSGLRPPARITGRILRTTSASAQSAALPVPPKRTSSFASIRNACTGNCRRSSFTGPPSNRRTLINGQPCRRRQNSGDSSPWSCNTWTPASRATSATAAGSPLFTKIPTLTVKGGSRRITERASKGSMKRGLPIVISNRLVSAEASETDEFLTVTSVSPERPVASSSSSTTRGSLDAAIPSASPG